MLDSTLTPAGLEGLQVTHREFDGGLCCVAAEGEVDLATAPVLKGALLARVATGATRLVLDLTGVIHMDSTGLGVLVGVRRRLPEDGVLAVAGARPAVRSVFELTGLDRTFKLFESAEEALAELRAPAAPQPALSPDAALVLGLAATAVPFADSRTAEAERWLRVLRLHGDAGRELSALGLGEAPLVEIVPTADAETRPPRRGRGGERDAIGDAARGQPGRRDGQHRRPARGRARRLRNRLRSRPRGSRLGLWRADRPSGHERLEPRRRLSARAGPDQLPHSGIGDDPLDAPADLHVHL